MPITTSYPGVYVEELPSVSHSVTAAPTSVTVFIGYTHPFKTLQFQGGSSTTLRTAVEIFSFKDYQDNCGGFFSFEPWLPDYVGNAVFQFFQNGGSHAWVVPVKAAGYQPGNVAFSPAEATLSVSPAAVTLTALEPGGTDTDGKVNCGTPTKVQLANRTKSDPQKADYDTADIIITYGNMVETYRAVPASDIAKTLGTADAPVSALVQVTAGGTTPASYPDPATLPPLGQPLVYTNMPPTDTTLINPADYSDVFTAGKSLDVDVPVFNLLVLPGISPVDLPQAGVLAQALAFCEQKRAFFIMDAPPNATTSTASPAPTQMPPGTPAQVAMADAWKSQAVPIPVSANGAIYFPYVNTVDPVTQQPSVSPPSGFVAGIYAREDAAWSVGKAPAGLETTLTGAFGVVPSGRMTDAQQGTLNNDGVNCLRNFPGNPATVVFGARTLVSSNRAFEQWKYVPVRRTALFIEQSLYASLGWAVFQPNDTPLWNALTQEVNAFMLTLFRQGSYFQGSTPSQAFLVQCDSTTTTQDDINTGKVNILVGFAPLKPAEFVIIQITQLAGQTQA